ncbi:MAG: MarR family transcriptional regulator [Pseudomonadota bacterium]
MKDTELALLIDRFMRRIHFGLQAKAHAFDSAGVGPGGGLILLTIAEMGRPELHQLTARVARDKSQMSRTIRSLEGKGLVERQTSPADARVSLIGLTPSGETVVGELKAAVAETIDEILAPISEKEEAILRDILDRALSEDAGR